MVELPAGGDWLLASLEFLGDPGKPGESVGQAHHHGADATRRVRVTVGERCHVVSVEVSRDWRDRVGAAGFAAAVLDAYTDALHQSLTAAAGTAYEVAHGPVDDGAPDGPVTPGPEHLSQLWESLRQLEATLDALPDPRAAVAPVRVAERTLAGTRGYLRVRARDGVVVAVDGDAARIARATDAAVCAEALELLHRARRDPGAAEEG